MWEVKISYCWGVIKILLMWRTTLLLADWTWGDLWSRRRIFLVNFYKYYRRLFPFHKDEWSRLLPRCASDGDGGAEDFSSALHLPSICKFYFQPRSNLRNFQNEWNVQMVASNESFANAILLLEDGIKLEWIKWFLFMVHSKGSFWALWVWKICFQVA